MATEKQFALSDRWWCNVGDVVWRGKQSRAVLAWMSSDRLWGITLQRENAPGCELIFSLDEKSLLQAQKLDAQTRNSIAETMRDRARGTGTLSDDDRSFLRALASALPSDAWVSGRRMRQQSGEGDKERFERKAARLIPRYARRTEGDLGDFYGLTLAGLFASGDSAALSMLDLLLSAIRLCFERNPDARTYDWDDLVAVGVQGSEAKLAWNVATVAQLMYGGGMADGGDRPNIRLGIPQDVEELLAASKTKKFEQYVLDAANKPARSIAGRVERPYWAAPLLLQEDNAQSDVVGRHPQARVLAPLVNIPQADDDLLAADIVMSCKILFLAANPSSTSRLLLDEEARDIEQKIRAADFRDSMMFRSRWAVRPDDLLQALNEDRPTVVHFSGHGAGKSGIVFHGPDGSERLVTAEALRHLFSLFQSDVRVVVLNACHSVEQAAAIADVIDCVVAMDDSVDDETAAKFAASFYRALGFGASIKNAFDQGIAIIKLEGLPDAHVPRLLVRAGVDPDLVFLVGVG